jgi:hypothetical protein
MKVTALIVSIVLMFGTLSVHPVLCEADEVPPAALAKAKSTADNLMKDLIGLLFSTLDAEGPSGAVRICADVAQDRSARHAREGIYVRRISQKIRNHANQPDAIELQKLEQLAALHQQKKLPAELVEVRANPDGIRQLHYLRPIVIMERCVICHGARDQIQPAVREILARRYPGDRAIDYGVGDFRGAISVRVTLEK